MPGKEAEERLETRTSTVNNVTSAIAATAATLLAASAALMVVRAISVANFNTSVAAIILANATPKDFATHVGIQLVEFLPILLAVLAGILLGIGLGQLFSFERLDTTPLSLPQKLMKFFLKSAPRKRLNPQIGSVFIAFTSGLPGILLLPIGMLMMRYTQQNGSYLYIDNPPHWFVVTYDTLGVIGVPALAAIVAAFMMLEEGTARSALTDSKRIKQMAASLAVLIGFFMIIPNVFSNDMWSPHQAIEVNGKQRTLQKVGERDEIVIFIDSSSSEILQIPKERIRSQAYCDYFHDGSPLNQGLRACPQ